MTDPAPRPHTDEPPDEAAPAFRRRDFFGMLRKVSRPTEPTERARDDFPAGKSDPDADPRSR